MGDYVFWEAVLVLMMHTRCGVRSDTKRDMVGLDQEETRKVRASETRRNVITYALSDCPLRHCHRRRTKDTRAQS